SAREIALGRTEINRKLNTFMRLMIAVIPGWLLTRLWRSRADNVLGCLIPPPFVRLSSVPLDQIRVSEQISIRTGDEHRAAKVLFARGSLEITLSADARLLQRLLSRLASSAHPLDGGFLLFPTACRAEWEPIGAAERVSKARNVLSIGDLRNHPDIATL